MSCHTCVRISARVVGLRLGMRQEGALHSSRHQEEGNPDTILRKAVNHLIFTEDLCGLLHKGSFGEVDRGISTLPRKQVCFQGDFTHLFSPQQIFKDYNM